MIKKLIFIAVAVAALFSISSCGSLTKVSDAEKAAIAKAIQKDDFKIVINNVSAAKMPMMSNAYSDTHTITFKNGEINGTLPYFGEVTGMAPMNPSDGGVNFDHYKAKYKAVKSPKGDFIIAFDAKLSSDNWKVSIEISDSGYVTMRMNGLNRTPITYRGEVVISE